MPCAKVRKKPGPKTASGVKTPAPSSTQSTMADRSDSSEPVSTMVSMRALAPTRLETKLPVK